MTAALESGQTPDQQSLEILSSILFRQRKIRLFDYKDRWFLRRLAVRMRLTHCENIQRYVVFIQSHPVEIDKLLDALAVNISSFFRNPEVWDSIATFVFDEWKKKMQSGHKRFFYAWSCACAQGEEPYTLAMLWDRWKKLNYKEPPSPELRITASDIDPKALANAKAANYDSRMIQSLPEDYRDEFVARAESYHIKPSVRKLVHFLNENVLSGERTQKFDLILCRNFLIFLDKQQQEKMFEIFRNSLQNEGYLVLGRVESILGPQKAGFRVVHATNRIYQRVKE